MASGATNPTLSTAITALGGTHVTHLVQPWSDATNMTALETELTRRWGGTVQLEMYGFTPSADR
jgi:phage tail sheath gpL-like